MTRENTVNVPVEPTREQQLAMKKALLENYPIVLCGEVCTSGNLLDAIYASALSAAPLHEGAGDDGNEYFDALYEMAGVPYIKIPKQPAAPPPSVEVFGSSAEGADTHRAAETPVVGWQDMSTLPHPQDAGMFWAAIRVGGINSPLTWEVHPIALDDETHKVTADLYQGWEIDAYEFWQPCAVPPPPAASVSPGTSAASEPNPSVEVERLREALSALLDLFAREDENSIERFDRLAEMFDRDTGYMAPGKSRPMHRCDQPDGPELHRIYDEWFAGRVKRARAALSRKQEPQSPANQEQSE